MNKERVNKLLYRLDTFADYLEREAKYYRKTAKEIKEELKKEGLI